MKMPEKNMTNVDEMCSIICSPITKVLYPQQSQIQLLLRYQTVGNNQHEANLVFGAASDESIRNVLSYLDGRSLCAVSQVCHYIHKLSINDEFWLNLCLKEWHIAPDQLVQQPKTYKSLYKLAYQSLNILTQELLEEQCLLSLQRSFQIPRNAAIAISRVMY